MGGLLKVRPRLGQIAKAGWMTRRVQRVSGRRKGLESIVKSVDWGLPSCSLDMAIREEEVNNSSTIVASVD